MQLLPIEMLGAVLSNVNQEGMLAEPFLCTSRWRNVTFLIVIQMAVLVNCSICTKIVRFFLQPAAGRKDGTGTAVPQEGSAA